MTKLLTTQDGNHLLTDHGKTVSFPTREAAEAEIRRRNNLRQRSDGGLNIITKHLDIQTGERA